MAPSPQARILDALVAIVDERGLDSVSFREVAAAAGVSIGTVQYYCRTKDDMLRLAYEHVADQLAARIEQVEEPTIAQQIRRVAHELLPLDAPRAAESRIYLAFAARAATSPALGHVQERLIGALRDGLTEAFTHAVDQGLAAPGLDPALAATGTAALVDGLLMHVLTDRAGLSPETAAAVIDTYIETLLPSTTSTV